MKATFLVLILTISIVSICGQNRPNPFTIPEIQRLLDIHNIWRINSSPVPTCMPNVTWDYNLQAIAQNWSNGCALSHNANRGVGYKNPSGVTEQVGENAAWGYSVIESTVNAWAGEYVDYNYTSNTCAAGKACGHYTQVVWANSLRIGCGRAICPGLPYGNAWFCNYAPAGNFVGQKPYVQYTSGSYCAADGRNAPSTMSCFGVLGVSPLSCNAKGYCLSQDRCSCINGWSGLNCNIPLCFGVNATLPNVCSGKGVCNSFDNCTCSSNWFSPNCSLTRCFGIDSNSSSVCSSRGACTAPNVCTCQNGWLGNNCSITQCSGVNSNSSTVCSSRGSCTGPNVCQCRPGFSGSNCENIDTTNPNVYCFGKNSTTNPVACSGRGSCTATDTCSCNSGFTGLECQTSSSNSTFYCFGKNSTTNPPACSGRGVCSAIDTCTCNTGFTGLECQTASNTTTFTCNGIISTNKLVCSGSGNCVGNDICKCFPGFNGTFCNVRTTSGSTNIFISVFILFFISLLY